MRTFRYLVLLVSIPLWLNGCGGSPEKAAEAAATEEAAETYPPEKAMAYPPAPAAKAAAAPEFIPRTKTVVAPKSVASSVKSSQVKSGQWETNHIYSEKIVRFSGMEAASRLPPPTDDDIHSYLVKIEAPKDMKMSIDPDSPTSGVLMVWIGQPKYEPKTQAGMIAASRLLETSIPAASAKVTPIVLNNPKAFEVMPLTQTTCQVISPTGTEVPFAITPIETGNFSLGASVEFFENRGCDGRDVSTKTAEPILVNVTVQPPSFNTLLKILWLAFKNFIAEILATLFATLVIVFRKRLLKLLGIEGDKP